MWLIQLHSFRLFSLLLGEFKVECLVHCPLATAHLVSLSWKYPFYSFEILEPHICFWNAANKKAKIPWQDHCILFKEHVLIRLYWLWSLLILVSVLSHVLPLMLIAHFLFCVLLSVYICGVLGKSRMCCLCFLCTQVTQSHCLCICLIAFCCNLFRLCGVSGWKSLLQIYTCRMQLVKSLS